MNERKAAASGGQKRQRMTNSVCAEDRNLLRRMERERRNQEVQQEQMQYERITPLFGEPYKIIKGDELSSRVQRMLGDYEDGNCAQRQCDVGAKELLFSSSYSNATQRPRPPLQKPSGLSDTSRPESSLDFSGPSGSVQTGVSWDTSSEPALSPPADPLSPLQTSDSDPDPSPQPRRAELLQIEAPPLSLSLPRNLHPNPSLMNPRKPTAYVRPMDGQDHVTSDSPELKASPEPYEDLSDLKISSETNLSPLKTPAQSAEITSHDGRCVLDILKEMTSWPPLLTSIQTPSSAEAQTLLRSQISFSHEEQHETPAQNHHELSDRLQQSDSSSDSNGSSDTDSESSNTEEPKHTTHTQGQKGHGWQLGRWLEMRENQQHQQNPESPQTHSSSHDSTANTRTEAGNRNHSEHRQTKEKHVCESLEFNGTRVRDEISHGHENTNTHKPKRKKTGRVQEQNTNPAATITSKHHTPQSKHRQKTQTSLVVKINLNLLSRVPQDAKTTNHSADAFRRPAPHTQTSSTGHKRAAERNEKSQTRKKQKVDKEGKQSFSSQLSLSQSEAVRRLDTMKKHTQTYPHRDTETHEHHSASQRKLKISSHVKKTSKRRCEQMSQSGAKPRPLLKPDDRRRSVEDHMKEAKRLKHRADVTVDKMSKALIYLEAALYFVESGVAMETDPQTPKSAYTMFSETLDLIRFILKLKNYTDPSAPALERDFLVLCLRCQSLLQMAMFRHRRDSALKYSHTLAEHFKSSSKTLHTPSPCVSQSSRSLSDSPGSSEFGPVVVPQVIQQVAASYVSITALFLQAHETWEEADEMTLRGSGLLKELDSVVGRLSLTSCMSSLVRYTRQGLHWLRLDAQNI